MTSKRALQPAPTTAQQPNGRSHRVYTVSQIVDVLAMSRRTFFRLRAQGQLPFLSEVEPRLGRLIRYRADLVDRYLAGQWAQPRFFRRAHGVRQDAGSPSQSNRNSLAMENV